MRSPEKLYAGLLQTWTKQILFKCCKYVDFLEMVEPHSKSLEIQLDLLPVIQRSSTNMNHILNLVEVGNLVFSSQLRVPTSSCSMKVLDCIQFCTVKIDNISQFTPASQLDVKREGVRLQASLLERHLLIIFIDPYSQATQYNKLVQRYKNEP